MLVSRKTAFGIDIRIVASSDRCTDEGREEPVLQGHLHRLVKRHWSFLVPAPVKESYDIWRIRRRHRRNLEQIEIDELSNGWRAGGTWTARR
jgi:hypothetical protein